MSKVKLRVIHRVFHKKINGFGKGYAWGFNPYLYNYKLKQRMKIRNTNLMRRFFQDIGVSFYFMPCR